jgi:hypothetical protein
VPFVVVGGHAVTFHGHVRATEDVDIVWLRSPDADRRLVAALKEVNACWIDSDIDPATGLERLVQVTDPYVASKHLLMLVTDYGFLDLFDYVPGLADVTPDELAARSVATPDGLRYASLDDLRRMKQASGRPKDMDDLQNLP